MYTTPEDGDKSFWERPASAMRRLHLFLEKIEPYIADLTE